MHRTMFACVRLLVGGAVLLAASGSAFAQDAPTTEESSAPTVRFNFSGAPFETVLDFFARETGLPVIRQAGLPGGAMSFISASRYSLAEAMEILNLNLRMHGVQLVREENFLYLRSLEDAARSPVGAGEPGDMGGVDRSQYVTATIPLSNAIAGKVAEQVRPLIKAPGMVQAIDAQNMLVVIETAPQVKRIRELLDRIDAVRPQSTSLRLFPLEHLRAAAAVGTLRGLVPEREQIMNLDKNNNPQIIDDVSKPALKLSADERLNAVVAVGPPDRMSAVEELVAMLDRPEGAMGESGEERMSSFTLEAVTPGEAAQQIEALFRGVSEMRRPKVLPLDGVGKLVVVGQAAQVLQAAALIGELDPAAVEGGAREVTGARVIDLTYLSPGEAEGLARRLMTPRQVRVLRIAAAPGNGGLIAAGPASDLEALEELITGLDTRPEVSQEVRRVSVGAGGSAVLEEARRVDGLTDASERDPVRATFDEATGTVMLVGSRGGISRFEGLLREAERAMAPRLEQRAFETEHRSPSQLAGELSRAVNAVLRPADGSVWVAPEVEALDGLGVLLVRAPAGSFETIERTLRELDTPLPGGRQTRVVTLFGEDPEGTLTRARSLYAERVKGLDDREAGDVSAEWDAASGRVILTGTAGGVRQFEAVLNELRQLTPPSRDQRVYELRQARAAEVIQPLRSMLEQMGPIDRTRRVEAPEIVVATGLDNALRVTAEAEQHRRIGEFLRLLDRADIETRTYKLETARPSTIVGQLQRLSRPLLTPDDGGPFTPPSFEALDELKTLLVRADASQFAVIGELIERLDSTQPGDRTVQIVRVRTGEPEGLLARTRELYAVDATGREEELGEVSAEFDRASGSLILRGKPDAVRLFQNALNQAQQLLPPDRTTRLIDVRNTDASKVLAPLQELLASADPVEAARRVPDAEIKIVERTNSLLVTAEDAQHRMIADFVRRLDVVDQTDLPPLKLLQVRQADVTAVAAMLTQQYESRDRTDRTARPVQIRADAATGTLIVSAHPDLLPEIQAFVEELNAERTDGPERETFIFPLKAARAVDVAQAMDKLYPEPPMPRDRRGNAMPWLQEKKEVTVSADPSSNSLIIDAPVERRESLERLAETLDRVEVAPVAQLRTYRIVGADPQAVSRMLQGLARQGTLSGPAQSGKQKVDVVIEVEPRSSTLIVAGDQVTFEKVEQVLSDLTAVPVERGLRIVPIANAQAGDVRDRAMTIYESQINQIPGAGPVDVTVDEGTNSLEVVADREAMDRFMRILEELQEQVGPAREVRLIELRLAKAQDVVGFLRDLSAKSESLRAEGGPEPVFEVIEATNAIMVAAQPGQFRIIEPLIRSLDNRQTADRPPLRILRLRSTDAGNIAQVLQRSYSRRTAEDRALRPVDIEADAATNTLIISAHEEVLPEIESIVRDLNESQAFDSEGREIRVFPLRVARADELARTMDQMYPEPPMPVDNRGRPMPWLQGRKEVFVRADPTTNSLIVDAPANRLNGFERLVENLDTLNVGDDVEVKTYRVERADASAVSRAIQQLANTGALAAAGRTPVTVSVEPSTRAIVVSGPSASFAQIDALVRDLDGPVNRSATVLKLYTLEHARADRLAATVEQMLSARLREQRALGAASVPAGMDGDVLEVAADRASNTLIINAPEELQEVAARLIEALDTESAEIGRASVRVVPLTFAEAGEVARTVSQSLPTMDLPSGEPALVRVLAALASNALVLSGPSRDLDKVQELIEPLDRQPFDPEKPSIETFPLEYADAGAIAQTVQRLLVDQQQTDPRVLMMQLRYSRGRMPETAPIRVEVEARTNALIVSGPAETIDLARGVIERLDMPASDDDRRVMTYTPGRADPRRLAETVSRVARETLPGGRKALEISADLASGVVLVIGTEEQASEAVRLLAEFDERSPAAPSAEIRTVTLENADARAVAGTLGQMLGDRSRWPESLRRAAEAGLAVPAPRVTAEPETNRLLVSVPAPLMGMAEELIAALDEPRGEGATDVRVFRLTRGDAESVSSALSRALEAQAKPGETRPVITPERGSNSVVVAGSAETLSRAGELIEAMDDVASEPAEVGVRTVFLRHARAETLAPIVQGVLQKEDPIDRLPWWVQENARLQRFQQGGARPAPIRVEPERRLNALVISAPVALLELASEVVGELDVDPAARAGGGRSVRVLTLANADAIELQQNIEAVFADDPSVTQPPTIRVDRSSNSLIVSATRDQMALVESLANDLDRATLRTGRQWRTIPVDRSRASAAEVAQTIRRMYERRGGVRVKVIGVDELLSADEEEGASAGEESPGPEGTEMPAGPGGSLFEVDPFGFGGRFGFVRAVVVSVATAQVAEDDEPEITIAVDPVTNTLVVVGSPRATDELARLADEVERQIPAEPTAIRFVELPGGADARQVANLINQTVRQVGRANAQNPGGFTGAVAVTADEDAGTLVVWANETDFGAIADVIRGVARLERTQRVSIKVYPLTNVDARVAARTVQDLFSGSPRGRQAQLLRGAEVELLGDGGSVKGRIDPRDIAVSASPNGGQLIISAPREALGLVDRFVSLIDQSAASERMEIRRYTLENADAQALGRTLQQLIDAKRQGPGAGNVPRARFVWDDRTNTLLVTASGDQHGEIEGLVVASDVSVERDDLRLEVIALQHARPSAVERVIDDVVVGRDPARAERVRVTAQDDTGVLIVRAAEEELAEIKGLVAQVDVAEAQSYPVRSIKLERADASLVARELQRFFQQRARVGRGGRGGRGGDAAIIGDRTSGTLVIASSDEDFEQISALASQFDAPNELGGTQFRVIPLQHIQAASIQSTLEEIGWQVSWRRRSNAQGGQAADEVVVDVNATTNSVILFGSGDAFETFEKIIAELDQPRVNDGSKVVRAVQVPAGDLRALERLIEQTTQTPDWGFWQGPDPGQVQVEVDQARRLVVLIGPEASVEKAAGQIEQIAAAAAGEEQVIETVVLKHAEAGRAAASLQRFFRERARSEGRNAEAMTILGSAEGNALIVAAPAADLALLKDLVGQIDQPELGEGRTIEVYTLANADPREAAATVRAMFPRRGRSEDEVIVTPQPSRGAIIVSALEDEQGRVRELLNELDRVNGEESGRMATVQLESARATEVARALRESLPANVRVNITPVERTNALLVTGSDEAVRLVMEQVEKLDTPLTSSPVEFRRFELKHAEAADTEMILRRMVSARPRSPGEPAPSFDSGFTGNSISVTASSDAMPFIEQMVRELDVPEKQDRRTEFVKLRFADAEQTAEALRVFYGRFAPEASGPAERAVTILSDPASNSLVISADEVLFEDIRALLSRLDTEEYDTSRQLVVLPLMHADAAGVARALNEGFRAPLEQELQRERARIQAAQRGRNNDRDFIEPTVLVTSEETPSVSAEVQTNSLIVFAGRKELELIRNIVEKLDVPDFLALPEARLIPVVGGARASALADSVRRVLVNNQLRSGSPRQAVIIGDDATQTLIVRAAQDEFEDIRQLALALMEEAGRAEATPRVIRLQSISAVRLRQTLQRTLAPLAQRRGELLAIEADAATNTLIMSSSREVYDRAMALVEELEGPVPQAKPDAGPGAGEAEGVVAPGGEAIILELANTAPADMVRLLNDLGVTRGPQGDRPSLVSEPVVAVSLEPRPAIAVTAGASDGAVVRELVRALDAEPGGAEQMAAVVPLKVAEASRLVSLVDQMLRAREADGKTAPAAAVAERARRLRLDRPGFESAPVELDLSVPIRLIADAQSNSVIVASSPSNVDAVAEVVKLFDALPIGDAVVVRMFPLDNASADRIKTVIDQLFSRGEALSRLPGTQRRGLPTTTTGQALVGEVTVSVDSRTNTLIVAGREEAVALVEVLVNDLDRDDDERGWLETAIVPLEYADAGRMAELLDEVLVRGLDRTPEATALQRQVGRLRLLAEGGEDVDPRRVESDLFAPLSNLLIVPEPTLNALIVVGTATNLEVVRSLLGMLDVEQAAASNSVRVFPLVHAAADRVANVVEEVFRGRERLPDARPEDRLSLSVDVRTNTLIVSTSRKSFEVLEGLLSTLDQPEAKFAVGLHVIPVPGADVRDLAPKIDRLMRERIQAARRGGRAEGPGDVFSIEAVQASDLLIVAASSENLALVNELIGVLTEGGAAASQSEVLELVPVKSSGGAGEIADAVNELYVDRENAKRGRGAVSVYPSERQNALIVSGNPADVEAVRRLVEQLDTARVEAVQEVKRVTLRAANALEIVRLVEGLLAGRPISGNRVNERQATRLRFHQEVIVEALGDGNALEATIDASVRERVRLTPDLRTNSVLISAPPEIMTLIEGIVRDLDEETRGDRQIASFRLANADAQQMALLLRDLFALEQQGDRLVLVPRGGDALDREGPDTIGERTLTPVPDERQALAITVDRRTNTLLVSGTREYLEEVRQVVSELDSVEANERERLVYHLRNAEATVIEEVLTSYFSGEADLLRSTLGPQLSGSLARQLEQEVTVVGDAKSNKLLISASPRYIDAVQAIVSELDAAPPQVMIQVLLAEVTLDDSQTWGMDINVGLTVPESRIFGDQYVLESFAAGAGVATAVGVPNFGVSSTDFSLLIRALETRGKLEVLSRPQVTVNNNEEAFIQVGEDVGIVTGSDRIGERVTAEVERRDVGIILSVTPSISADGFVRMDIAPEISSVSARTTPIGDDIESPIITQRRVETTVTVKDGQTVVIGGLIQTQSEERESKVPFLGDIPILGLPFRSLKRENVKTELLVILTPVVIPGESPAAEFVQDDIFEKTLRAVEDKSSLLQALDRNPIAKVEVAPIYLTEEALMGPFRPGEEPPAGAVLQRDPVWWRQGGPREED